MRLADLPVVVDTNEGGEALLVDSFTSLANFTFSFQDFFTLRRFDPKRDVLFALELTVRQRLRVSPWVHIP